MEISVSDFRSFLRCRRQWDLSSPNRQSLKRPMTHKPYFLVGSIVHAGLEQMAMGIWEPDNLDGIVNGFINELEEQYIKIIGVPYSAAEREQFDSPREQARGMLENYMDHYEGNTKRDVGKGEGTLGANYEFIHVELPFSLPIPGTGGNGVLRGMIDGLAVNVNSEQVWLVENKTYQRQTNLDNLMLDDQFRVYLWVYKQLTGKDARGIIYNGLYKKVPGKPKVLKSGKMSTAAIDTTVRVYTEELLNNGLLVDDYEEHLAELARKEASTSENPFFKRHFIALSDKSLKETEWLLQVMHSEMSQESLLIYPNRPFSGCNDCSVRTICDAMTLGEDVGMAKEGYVVSEPYGSFSAKNPVRPGQDILGNKTPLWVVQERIRAKLDSDLSELGVVS